MEPWHETTSRNQAYIDLMKKNNVGLDEFSTAGYISAMAFVEALKSIKGEVTRESVGEALKKLQYKTTMLAEPYSFNAPAGPQGGNAPNVSTKMLQTRASSRRSATGSASRPTCARTPSTSGDGRMRRARPPARRILETDVTSRWRRDVTMSVSPFADLRGLPYYDEPSLHMNLAGQLWAWEFEGWKPETMSWKTGCYIHGGLSRQQTIFRGPDVKEFFSSILVNSLENFPVGSMKHGIYCNEDGLHDRPRDPPAQRRARVPLLRRPALAALQAHELADGSYDVEIDPTPRVPLPDRRADVAGDAGARDRREPAGHRASCASATRRSTARPSRSAGSACRGNLAYELRGPLEDGPEIYDAVFKAGKDLGIQRLGWRTYLVNHVEGGFPQMNWQFYSAADLDPGLHGDGRGQRVQPAVQRRPAASTPPTCAHACAPRSRSAGSAR